MQKSRPDTSIKSWLFTVLRNIWINRLRQSRTTLFFDKGLTDAAVGAGDQDCLLGDIHNVPLSGVWIDRSHRSLDELGASPDN
jgi:DNA-directed RNA polymerase specialized sigma24 family protein